VVFTRERREREREREREKERESAVATSASSIVKDHVQVVILASTHQFGLVHVRFIQSVCRLTDDCRLERLVLFTGVRLQSLSTISWLRHVSRKCPSSTKNKQCGKIL